MNYYKEKQWTQFELAMTLLDAYRHATVQVINRHLTPKNTVSHERTDTLRTRGVVGCGTPEVDQAPDIRADGHKWNPNGCQCVLRYSFELSGTTRYLY